MEKERNTGNGKERHGEATEKISKMIERNRNERIEGTKHREIIIKTIEKEKERDKEESEGNG